MTATAGGRAFRWLLNPSSAGGQRGRLNLPNHSEPPRTAHGFCRGLRIKSALVSYRWERIRYLGCISSHTTAYVNVNVNVNVNVDAARPAANELR